jgi:hypothetical protein
LRPNQKIVTLFYRVKSDPFGIFLVKKLEDPNSYPEIYKETKILLEIQVSI